MATHSELQRYAGEHGLQGLSLPTLAAIIAGKPGYTDERGRRFLRFQQRIDRELLNHRVITANDYTAWFARGPHNQAQITAFVVQFSVFSNLFLIAQLHKMINADTLEGMRASKEILANEIGVVFRPPGERDTVQRSAVAIDPELVSTQGSIEGGTFRFQAAHFEWLLRMAEKLGLSFSDVGKRCHGTEATLFFCDELVRLYGSSDYLTSQAASYAVENWAAAGFWDELVTGFERYNAQSGAELPLSFFTWHSRLEAQHAQHTQEELEELYFSRPIDEDQFIRYGNEMLDGVWAFWDGLDQQRRQLQAPH